MILQLEEEEEVLMNINKFLVKAKEAGIDVSEIKISKTSRAFQSPKHSLLSRRSRRF